MKGRRRRGGAELVRARSDRIEWICSLPRVQFLEFPSLLHYLLPLFPICHTGPCGFSVSRERSAQAASGVGTRPSGTLTASGATVPSSDSGFYSVRSRSDWTNSSTCCHLPHRLRGRERLRLVNDHGGPGQPRAAPTAGCRLDPTDATGPEPRKGGLPLRGCRQLRTQGTTLTPFTHSLPLPLQPRAKYTPSTAPPSPTSASTERAEPLSVPRPRTSRTQTNTTPLGPKQPACCSRRQRPCLVPACCCASWHVPHRPIWGRRLGRSCIAGAG